MGQLNFSEAKIVIPVDGPAGSGKSTMAKAIADSLGWDYLETGALYRAVGLSVLDMGGNLNNSEEATFHDKNLNFECRKTSSALYRSSSCYSFPHLTPGLVGI